MRMIRLVLADTSLEPRLSTGDCRAFATSIGTPHGDSLSPVLFTLYLEAALRDLRSRLRTRPLVDANVPLDVEYADDTDFISTSRLFLDDIERIAPACLAEWSLTINASKTERSSVCRHADRVDEEWHMTRKIGSLLGEAEDVARRKQLANVAFRKLSNVWFRRSRISLPLRLRLCDSFVVPMLTYNMGTWGLTKAELERLDAYHRRHLRQIIGIHWPHHISNTALYRRCRCRPISDNVKSASVRPRVTHATGRTRSTSDRLLFRRHRSCHFQRATTNESAHRVECWPSTRRTYSTSPCWHRSASPTRPRTMATTGAGHSWRIVNQLIETLTSNWHCLLFTYFTDTLASFLTMFWTNGLLNYIFICSL